MNPRRCPSSASVCLDCGPGAMLNTSRFVGITAEDWRGALASFALAAGELFSIQPDMPSDAPHEIREMEQLAVALTVLVLLDRCLAVLAADSMPDVAHEMPFHTQRLAHLVWATQSPRLQDQLAVRLQRPQRAECSMHALQVLTSLGSSAADSGMRHGHAALLLGQLCQLSFRHTDSTAKAVAWPFVQALPQLAGKLAALAADSRSSALQLARFCDGIQRAAEVLLPQVSSFSSDGQVSAWAAACDAALRLVPTLLLDLHERCTVLTEMQLTLRLAPSKLAQQLLALLGAADTACRYTAAKHIGKPLNADEQATRQLWSLHTCMCRLLHWVAADRTHAQATLLFHSRMQALTALLRHFGPVIFALQIEAPRAIKQDMFR